MKISGIIGGMYMAEPVMGVFRDDTRSRGLTIVHKLVEQDGIQAVILGGTELPLLLRDSAGSPVPFLDTTRIHVPAAVGHMLSA